MVRDVFAAIKMSIGSSISRSLDAPPDPPRYSFVTPRVSPSGMRPSRPT